MHDLSLHILDLIENSLKANATIVSITLDIDIHHDFLKISIDDNGEGFCVSPETLTDPFFTTNPLKKTGLGLSLFKTSVDMVGGDLRLSKSGELGGAHVSSTMKLSHVNRLPIGDLATTISTMVCTNSTVDFRLIIQSEDRFFCFSSLELVRERGFKTSSNIQIANAVLSVIQKEQKIWKEYESSIYILSENKLG